jgi:restriction system protein
METSAVSMIVFTALVIGLIVLGLMGATADARRKHALKSAVDEIVQKHKDALARQRMTLVSKDPYGIVDTRKWEKEIKRFTENVVMPRTNPGLRKVDPSLLLLVGAAVSKVVLPHAEELSAKLNFDPAMSPAMFEHWCGKTLGWKARVTVASGDQGADVVVEKGGVLGVIQCKLYSKPVGNKAVQEAHSAKSHYGAGFAAVVSNAAYTPSARALASSTGVHLLHVSDLSRLDALLAVEMALSA